MVSEPEATSDKLDGFKSHGVRTKGDLSIYVKTAYKYMANCRG
jgi:hypothetical protein